MSYRHVPMGDVRDVASAAKTAVNFATDPVGAVLNFLGGQVLGGIFGESEQDKSIRLFNERFKAQLAAMQQRMRSNPRAFYRSVLSNIARAKRNPRLRFR